MSGQQIEISMEDYESLRMQFPNLTHGELLGLHIIFLRLRFHQEALSSNESLLNRLTLLESNQEVLNKRLTEVENSKKLLEDENEDLKKQLMKKQNNEK